MSGSEEFMRFKRDVERSMGSLFGGDDQQYEEMPAKRILFALIKLAVKVGRVSTRIHKI
jgi:hypothetical protein